MGLSSADPLEGGGGREEGGAVLPSGSPGDPDIWARDVGSDPPHGEDPGGFHHWVEIQLTGQIPRY